MKTVNDEAAKILQEEIKLTPEQIEAWEAACLESQKVYKEKLSECLKLRRKKIELLN